MSDAELRSYSDEFIMHSYQYYGKHVPTPGNGQLQVHGLYQLYQGEALRRGLIKRDPLSNCYVRVTVEEA